MSPKTSPAPRAVQTSTPEAIDDNNLEHESDTELEHLHPVAQQCPMTMEWLAAVSYIHAEFTDDELNAYRELIAGCETCEEVESFDLYLLCERDTREVEAAKSELGRQIGIDDPHNYKIDWLASHGPPIDVEATPFGEPEPPNRLREHLYWGRQVGKIPQADPLVGGYIDKNSLTVLFAPSGAGKTFLALDIACCVATGIDWHGAATDKGPVLYLYLEGAQKAVDRLDAWLLAHPSTPEPESNLAFMTAHDFNMYSPSRGEQVAPLNRDLPDVLELIEEIKPSLIVIDTYAVATTGADENRAEHVNVIVQHLKTMKAASSAALLVVHHPGKDESKGMRGSNALFGAADAVYSVSSASADEITMVSTKHKDKPTGQDVKHFRLERFGPSVAVTSRAAVKLTKPANSGVALEALELADEVQGLATAGWLALINELRSERGEKPLAKTTLHTIRKDLVNRGQVVETGTNKTRKYSLAARAQAALDAA